MLFDKVKDSGVRQDFITGSRRDTQQGKGRPDLMPIEALRRLAVHYENGAAKYGDRNWEKGQPLSRYYASAMRHLWAFMDLDFSEDHLSAISWNAFALVATIERIQKGVLPRELDDIGFLDAYEDYQREIAAKDFDNKSPASYTLTVPQHSSITTQLHWDTKIDDIESHIPHKDVWDKDRFNSKGYDKDRL